MYLVLHIPKYFDLRVEMFRNMKNNDGTVFLLLEKAERLIKLQMSQTQQ